MDRLFTESKEIRIELHQWHKTFKKLLLGEELTENLTSHGGNKQQTYTKECISMFKDKIQYMIHKEQNGKFISKNNKESLGNFRSNHKRNNI